MNIPAEYALHIMNSSITRRLLALALIASSSIAVAAASRPNLVLVMADDQGWGQVGYNGHPAAATAGATET